MSEEDIFDFSKIRPQLKAIFRQAGIDVVMICRSFNDEERRLMPFEDIQGWFYATKTHPLTTNLIPTKLVTMFLMASIRAIESLEGQVTEIDRQRIGQENAPSAMFRRFRRPK